MKENLTFKNVKLKKSLNELDLFKLKSVQFHNLKKGVILYGDFETLKVIDFLFKKDTYSNDYSYWLLGENQGRKRLVSISDSNILNSYGINPWLLFEDKEISENYKKLSSKVFSEVNRYMTRESGPREYKYFNIQPFRLPHEEVVKAGFREIFSEEFRQYL